MSLARFGTAGSSARAISLSRNIESSISVVAVVVVLVFVVVVDDDIDDDEVADFTNAIESSRTRQSDAKR